MVYNVLCFCSTSDFFNTIESALNQSDLNHSLYSVSCENKETVAKDLQRISPSVIVIDFAIGTEKVKQILSFIKSSPLSQRVATILATPSTDIVKNDYSFFSEFDDCIVYPNEADTLSVRISLAVARRSRINHLLEKSEQLNDISTAASKAGSSLIIIDSEGKIVWVNDGFELLYECNLDEFCSKFGDNVFSSSMNEITAKSMQKCVDSGENVVYESVWYTNSNKRKNIQTSITPIYDIAGKLTKIIAIETDITELKMAEEALSDKHDNLLSTMEHLEEANKMLDEQRTQIEKQKTSLEEEKNKSEALLLNILPEVAAHQLKKKGFVKPKKYNEVSVMFADFVNFSSVSVSYETIEDFLAALSFYFESFDEITTQRFIEKIKTIGDCYMCVGGVPQKNNSHHFDTVLAALEIQRFVEEKAKVDQANGVPVWRLRIGIHTGSVMAGVIGKKKFAYDVWGDTVNVASRMESKGEAGKVNISETTYEAIKTFFKCNFRGKVYAKNIGEINMYFVERILPEYSEDPEVYIPNALFRKELSKY